MAILHPNKSEFDELIKTGIVLADFYADWCGPCKMLAPLIEQLDKDYDGKVKVAKINVDEESELAAEYGISSIPAVIVFKNGESKAFEVGYQPIDAYKGILDSLI